MSYYLSITKDASRCEYYVGVEREGEPAMDVDPLGPLFVNCMYSHAIFSVFYSKDALIKDVLDTAAIVRVSL